MAVDGTKLLLSVFQHIALPPKLPGSRDSHIENIEKDLTTRMLDAVQDLRVVQSGPLARACHHVYRSLQTCLLLNLEGTLTKASLLKGFSELQPGETLILHVAEQNAGIIIRRDISGPNANVIFEAFEASPISKSVLESENALQSDFPGRSVALPFADFIEPSFQENLARFLEQASSESIGLFSAHTKKAGVIISESRDTVNPALITQMLMTLLEAKGVNISTPVTRKRVRDDVCWDNAYSPWRRLPFWLVLRVTVQRQFCLLLGGEAGRVQYKFVLAIMHAKLLEDGIGRLSPENLMFLKSKLCRRLAKLEADKLVYRRIGSQYEELFTKLSPFFSQVIQKTTEHVNLVWTTFKNISVRTIPTLPRRASERDMFLTLPNSGQYLQGILSIPLPVPQNKGSLSSLSAQRPLENSGAKAASDRLNKFARRYYSLMDMETNVKALQSDYALLPSCAELLDKRCLAIAKRIRKYLKGISDAYQGNPEQNSNSILILMELWVLMDKCGCKRFPLLKDFDPAFHPDLLDVLQIPTFEGMCRLRKVQAYLSGRLQVCHSPSKTIFHDPAEGCFAERYFNESLDAPKLQYLQECIESKAEQQRCAKEREWRRLSAEYDSISREIGHLSCPPEPHDRGPCPKCYQNRCLRRLAKTGIKVFEHPLPRDAVLIKVVLFELGIPESFAALRDATWSILSTFSSRENANPQTPKEFLSEYSPLGTHRTSKAEYKVSLASKTKSFLVSHYSRVRLPVDFSKVCVPLGLCWSYYDKSSQSWLGSWPDQRTFSHHCRLNLPKKSPFSLLQKSPEFSPDANGPSSYEVVARQVDCPPELNVHEFSALQALFSGKLRRWPTMLLELGSSTLNFSSEATMLAFCQLALQAGPQHEDGPLRAVHGIFQDSSFCRGLLTQVNQRLKSIATNWRESYFMELLLTILLRLWSLGSRAIKAESIEALMEVRKITLRWVRLLRAEIHRTTQTGTATKSAEYALWASLLCRRTFSIYGDEDQILDGAALGCFIEASIAVQENLVCDTALLPLSLKNALVRNLKMTYGIQSLLRRSITTHVESLCAAINSVWPEPEGAPRTYSEWLFLPHPYERWIALGVPATEFTSFQTVHYHVLEGYLLIDGQPLGQLPPEYLNTVMVKELFGNQHLLTFPSSLPDMTYMLSIPINGNEIHFGFRDKNLVIRARFRKTLLEFVERSVFGGVSNHDLPGPLLNQCVHWLDLKRGELHIRKHPNIWKPAGSSWILNVNTRQASRRRSRLVDPHSALFQKFARIFDCFEYREHLTVYQPQTRFVTVELKRLELQFTVNANGLLQSPQLRSEIDPNQDAGTLYGLKSILVLRETANKARRSIIIPVGALKWKLDGIHVSIIKENKGVYGRFVIDDILGRLQCPAEPLLLYLKAQLHAYTSFVLPDPLTGRTGTEEALECLQSGICQPWMPISEDPHITLLSIARLTPKRKYYPEDMKCQQTIFWDENLTSTIQHDAYQPLVDVILEKSHLLSRFEHQAVEIPLPVPDGEVHLRQRSYLRRLVYDRPNSYSQEQILPPDLLYKSRASFQPSLRNSNVRQIVDLIQSWPQTTLHTTHSLARMLEAWKNIGGWSRPFDVTSLTDLLTVRLASEWGSLASLCRASSIADKSRLTFLLGTIAFNNEIEMDALRTLVSYAVFEDLKPIDPPVHFEYEEFENSKHLDIGLLMDHIRYHYPAYIEDSSSRVTPILTAEHREGIAIARRLHSTQCEEEGKKFAQFLLGQWPCEKPISTGFSATKIDTGKILENLYPLWLRFFHNLELSWYLEKVQQVLGLHSPNSIFEQPKNAVQQRASLVVFPTRVRGSERATLRALLCKEGPSTTATHPDILAIDSRSVLDDISNRRTPVSVGLGKDSEQERTKLPFISEVNELEEIVNSISDSSSSVRKQYAKDLMQSLTALRTLESHPKESEATITAPEFSPYLVGARQAVKFKLSALCSAFEQADDRIRWLQDGNLWPCITPITLLEQLRTTSVVNFGKKMKDALIDYAVAITSLQRLLRMEDAHYKKNWQMLSEEHRNIGHGNWEPSQYPDWLLFEIEANILIRDDQVDVALATISPTSGSNSVLQMNMGQGKTSCIIPMVAAVLSDSKKLARVIVPKPLLRQTAQLLQSRLGGLLGRQVRHVPFSRKTSTTAESIYSYGAIHSDILKSSGVVLSLPESILSFKLSGLQRLSDKSLKEAKHMIKVQDWMNRVCRDVLDESDFTLAVRTQLIYPSGPQNMVDGHPHRWETAESLLKLVKTHLWSLKEDFPHSIDVVEKSNVGFPLINFVRKDVEDALIGKLANDICNGHTSIIPATVQCTNDQRSAIRQFISNPEVEAETADQIRLLFPDKLAIRQNIFLLRGLLVHRILILCLKKRWNVQYGLHPDRQPMAVPFHAKGVPSTQAEWGHPDVAILLTCLAFYYGGLTLSQIRQSLQRILQSDDPSSDYDRWIHSAEQLPDALREWNLINVEDDDQMVELFQHFQYSVVVIDYFLNNFVFPKHAKEFSLKLQASGWDIPLFMPSPLAANNNGVETLVTPSKPLTTGFSGTNDNRRMLPLTIIQNDLPRLSHTNAEVLTYLLQPRNRGYMLLASEDRKHLSEGQLLEKLRDNKIRILIDAGAHVLEMDNQTLAAAWLRVDYEAEGAVYFDNDNRAWVLYKNGLRVPFLASPFADNLEGCLVYLDEAHTRGTDLKMPARAHGAVTLRLGQTKDQTVQAAMRLRQLGTSQSITFFAAPDVHQSILDLRKKNHGDPVDSSDVVHWLLEQTCAGIEQLVPLYLSQGIDFCRRTQAALDHPKFSLNSTHRADYLKVLESTEHQGLEQLYAPDADLIPHVSSNSFTGELRRFSKMIIATRKGFQDSNFAQNVSAFEEVEQEREVAFEVEAVRQVQKPTRFSPLSFPGLDQDILLFAQTGHLRFGSASYVPAFSALAQTGLGLKYGINSSAVTPRLYVSREFTRTIKVHIGHTNDNFIRSPNWILWCPSRETAMIIIPEEAELLIPILYKGGSSTHLLTYAAPVTRKMLHFNNLTYYAIPRLPEGWTAPIWLTVELGIFSGRLYFDFNEYPMLKQYLGMVEDGEGPEDRVVDVSEDDRVESGEMVPSTGKKTFTAQPLNFLHEWLAVRRKGQDFMHTPMGYICQGEVLKANHPFFAAKLNTGVQPVTSNGLVAGHGLVAEGEEGYDDLSDAEDELHGNGEAGLDRDDGEEGVGVEEWDRLDSEGE
ncbi:hypothetical protein FQN51_005126 [Onygenales sp. PD_10]|nr:hypothetical protein FQN51_005126 [Onygenales sp. PD_10]